MKKSSARLHQPDLFDAPSSFEQEPNFSSTEETDGGPLEADSAPLKLSTFGLPNLVYADAARRAGRLNAANVSEQEYQALLRERQLLLDKKFEGIISKPESNRLEYVRWSLDRIEDAKHGASLDALEDSVTKFELFLSEMQDLKSQLTRRMKGSRR